jgi:hypothetical protein
MPQNDRIETHTHEHTHQGENAGSISRIIDVSCDRRDVLAGNAQFVLFEDVPFFWDAVCVCVCVCVSVCLCSYTHSLYLLAHTHTQWDVELHHLQKQLRVGPAQSVCVIDASPLRARVGTCVYVCLCV